jgi:hypothetical protein
LPDRDFINMKLKADNLIFINVENL